jgi:hypothetical protein
MVMTPEARTKQKINKLLDSYDGRIYKYMPVPGGYGKTTIDYLLCFDGLFIGIEAKAPGEKPTPRQNDVLADIRAAGGSTFVIDDDYSLEIFASFLRQIRTITAEIICAPDTYHNHGDNR